MSGFETTVREDRGRKYVEGEDGWRYGGPELDVLPEGL